MSGMRRRKFITLLGGAAGRRAPNSYLRTRLLRDGAIRPLLAL
jgi:hypothetical protein